jgi:hypothetical protein
MKLAPVAGQHPPIEIKRKIARISSCKGGSVCMSDETIRLVEADQTASERMVTNGVRANGSRVFTIEFTGRKLYELLNQLEANAVASQHYTEVSRCVLMAEYMREQAKSQGY